MDTIPVRFKPMRYHEKEADLVLCGMRDKNDRQTCPVVFGEMWHRRSQPHPANPIIMNVYGIFKPVRPGVYQPTKRTIEQAADGKDVRLRRSKVRDSDHPHDDHFYNYRNFGPQGDAAGELVKDFPICVLCYRCREWNEVS